MNHQHVERDGIDSLWHIIDIIKNKSDPKIDLGVPHRIQMQVEKNYFLN